MKNVRTRSHIQKSVGTPFPPSCTPDYLDTNIHEIRVVKIHHFFYLNQIIMTFLL